MAMVSQLVTCRDCGHEFTRGAQHWVICIARKCERCGVVRSLPIPKGEDGKRVCIPCLVG